MGFYATRLIRRELSLLASYRLNGRSPRIGQLAYWRASFIPLALGLTFFLGRALGLADTQAALAAGVLLLGLVLADMQLFVLNAGAWIFARRTLDWGAVARLYADFHGQAIDLRQAAAPNRWDAIVVSPAHLQGIAAMYQRLKKQRPDVGALIQQSQEARVLGITTFLALVIMLISPQLVGVTFTVYLFVSAFTARRLKAAIDFHLTWPVLQQAFNWDEIRRLG